MFKRQADFEDTATHSYRNPRSVKLYKECYSTCGTTKNALKLKCTVLKQLFMVLKHLSLTLYTATSDPK